MAKGCGLFRKYLPSLVCGCCLAGWHGPRKRVLPGRNEPFQGEEFPVSGRKASFRAALETSMKKTRCSTPAWRAKFSFRRMDSMALVFWKDLKDVPGWERYRSCLGCGECILLRYFKYRPTFGTDSYYFSGSSLP